MLFYLIATIIIIVSLLIIIFIIAKKLPGLTAINVESIVQEKNLRAKNRILLERLNRIFSELKKLIAAIIKPVFESLSSIGGKVYQKTIELEKKNLPKQPLGKIDLKQELAEKIDLARKLLATQEFAKSEEICISVLGLDKKNLAAYEILAEIYREQKEYKKARETYRHLIKLINKSKAEVESNGTKHRLANFYADLGLIYQLENRNSYALANFQKAVELESHNPRFLDLLLKISIILKNKNLAWQVFNNLKKADPENQKLVELKEEINNLPT